MNKFIISIGVIVAVSIAGWFLFSGSTVDYVATVDDEVTQLEHELALLEASVTAGTLSSEDAAHAQTKIVARINAINMAAAAGQSAHLTDAQRAQLIDGLGRLQKTLVKYSATLVAVDTAVFELPEAQRPKLNRKGGGSKTSIATIATETVATVEQQVEEIIADITDEEIVDDVTATINEEMIEEATASTSDEAVIDDGSEDVAGSEETVVEDETTGTDDSGTGVVDETNATASDFIFNATESDTEVDAHTTTN